MKNCLLNLISTNDIIKYLAKNNTAENRKLLLITDKLRYRFCYKVEDRKDIWEKISKYIFVYCYCRNVKDRPEIRKRITTSKWAYYYCNNIKDRPEIRKYITKSEWAYTYCKNVKNRPEIRRYITDEKLLAKLN